MKRICIITGATGGLGKEYVKYLINEDIDEIWAIARNKIKLERLLELSKKIKIFSLNLSKIDDLKRIEDLLKEDEYIIKYLFNNASTAKMGKYDEYTYDEVNDTLNVNVTSPTLLTYICIPYMEKGSKIVNICSMAGFQPVPYINIYAATKAYLKSYTLGLNEELKKTGVKACAVCPGWINTEMLYKEYNGVKTSFPMIKTAKYVVDHSMKDIKNGKVFIKPSFYVKYVYFLSRFVGDRLMIKIWMNGLKKYLK
ncbi:MAG: SDR family NAD(P)-dependent oxidoreductase [Anaeroplasma sp.]|nr:SDR family NAD(P)-dependent oxidoreductase [Anaeroplasma sp.]